MESYVQKEIMPEPEFKVDTEEPVFHALHKNLQGPIMFLRAVITPAPACITSRWSPHHCHNHHLPISTSSVLPFTRESENAYHVPHDCNAISDTNPYHFIPNTIAAINFFIIVNTSFNSIITISIAVVVIFRAKDIPDNTHSLLWKMLLKPQIASWLYFLPKTNQ